MTAAVRGPGRFWPGSLLLLIASLLHQPVHAQDPVRTDTSRVVADSARPPRVMLKHARGFEAGFGQGVWVWERADLLREGALTLLDLLQRLPSVTSFRSGFVLQPEISSGFGHTRGRVQVLLDGYELDPLLEGTLDHARIELGNLQRVRVERRLDVTRIELSSLEPTDARPHSHIEAGVGEPDTNLFRGLFLAPRLFVGPVGFALDRTDTDGLRGREPAEHFAGWGKVGFIRDRFGLQAEVRQGTLERGGDVKWVGQGKRRDLMVRGRLQPVTGLVAEGFIGQSRFENDTTRAEVPDTVDLDLPEMEVLQWGVGASVDNPRGWGRAMARFRNHDALPQRQLELEAGLRLSTLATLAGNFTHASWAGVNVSSYNLRAVTAPYRGAHLFAEMTAGDRGAPNIPYLNSDSVWVNHREAFRVGGGFARWGGFVNAALLKVKSDSVQAFGLPYDSTDQRFRGADLTGWEIEWHAPLLLKGLAAIGSFTNWPTGTVPLYLPNQQWRAGLQYHNTPLKSGNLELLGRIEMRRRGALIAPALSGDTTGPNRTAAWEAGVLQGYDQIDGYLQIRILDVRIFLRGENLRNLPAPELPGRTLTGGRIMYGVKWSFWN